MNWHTSTSQIPMIGPVYAKRLEKLEIFTIQDLLWHLPSRYDDFSKIVQIAQLEPEQRVTLVATITSIKNLYTRSGKTIQNATLSDKSGQVEATWFNQPYITRTLKIGDTVALSGKALQDGFLLKFQSPEYELVREGRPLLHTGRLVPVYPQTTGVSSKWLRSRISPLLHFNFVVNDYLPDVIRIPHQLIPLGESLMSIHFPSALSQISEARKRLAFDELFLLQLRSQLYKKQWEKHELISTLTINEEKILEFITSLPFHLTTAQKRAVSQICADLADHKPMNRLLQGDVGSGKTVVAAIGMYATYLNDARSLLMAPTEILAQQHFMTLNKLLGPFGVNVQLVTASEKPKAIETADILVGTHALIDQSIKVPDVRFVVIDEQHRFGVRQRALLREKGNSPHVLTMTATPIPRTVTLIFHGDLDLSLIDEMPQGRIPVKTWVVPPLKRTAAYDWIRKQLTANTPHHQAFIVCPFVEISESQKTVKAATDEFERLTKEVFPDLSLGLLHGKMKIKDKNNMLEKFRNNEFEILVSTPVVEVGIDIPNATIMVIEAAERFGLAQLHQLRGRVGRGNAQSYCLVFSESTAPQSIHRLKQLEHIENGQKLAELDLTLRGAGSRFGLRQHGEEELKIATYSDTELVQFAREEGKQLLDQDPGLLGVPLLKERVLSGTIEAVAPD